MGRYRICMATGAWLFSGSFNRVQLWLVGERGEAELELQLRPVQGQVSGGSWDPNPRRAHGRRPGRVTARRSPLGLPGVGTPAPKRAEGGGWAQPLSPSPTDRGPRSLHYFPS